MKLLKLMLTLAILVGSAGAASAQNEDDLNSLLGPAPPSRTTQSNATAAEPSATSSRNTTPSPAAPSGRFAKTDLTPIKSTTQTNGSSTNSIAAADKPNASNSKVSAKSIKAVSVEKKETAKVNPVEKNRLIEEIIVTATKRRENIQTVPIAISAFSGAKLDALGIQSPKNLPRITPGLTFTTQAGYNIIYLRGVGSDAFLPAADQDVPTYLDGVALVQGEGNENTLGRVKRVEVLKGPQGTLFGRNSTGGAISIITPDPGPNFSGDINVGFGNFGELNELVYLNVPIIDGLAATVSGYSYSHYPYQTDQVAPTVATYSRGGRIKVLWHATDDLSFNFSGLYGESASNSGMAKENTRVAPALSLIIPQDPSLNYRYSENIVGGIAYNNYLFAGGGEWDLPWAKLKLILSKQKFLDTYANYDYDGSAAPLISFRPRGEFGEQRTGELQILSNPDTPFDQYFSWVAGAYYLDGIGGFPDLDLNVAANNDLLNAFPGGLGFANALNTLVTTAGLPALLGANAEPVTAVSGGLLKSRSLSGYFQGRIHLQPIFDLSDQVNLIVGARLDRETRGLQGNFLGARNPLDQQQVITLLQFQVPDVTAVQVPLKLEIQWFPVDLTQVYASFSRGFTAPTYNTVNFFSAPDQLQPQKVNSYELGAKTQLFNQTLTFDAAVFYIQEKELLTGLASLTSGGVVRFDNVPAARIYGAEFDFTWEALPDYDPGLVLHGSFSYLNSRYTDYPDARGFDATTGLSYGAGAFLPARNATGNRIVRTPPITYNIGINQSIPLGAFGRLEVAAETNYSASFFFDPANTPVYANPSYRLIDARASYFYNPWGLEVTAYGNNLTKAKYYASEFLLDSGNNIELNDPRTFGLRFKYSF